MSHIYPPTPPIAPFDEATPMTTLRTLSALIALSALVIAIAALGTGAVQCDDDVDRYWVEIHLPNHMVRGMHEQDVFIARDGEPGVMYRITADDVDLDALLYAAATSSVRHAVDPGGVGPFEGDPALGVNQGAWLEGVGHAVVTCDGDVGRVSATFDRLVPNGVYTVWYFLMAMPPTTPFATSAMPLGDPEGSQNTFVADAYGSASFEVEVSPCLQLSGRQLLAGLAAAYHSDGKTYGGLSGDFGAVAHPHVFNFLPGEACPASAGSPRTRSEA